MTSKNLFFKRMKQDLEQRIWLPVIFLILGFLFSELPLVSWLNNWQGRTDAVVRANRYLLDSFFTPGSVFTALTIGVAIISALSGLAYMHSAKKLDVYHSIPIKRERLFLQQYSYGILYYLIPMILHILICIAICGVNGLLSAPILQQALWFALVQFLIYLAVYATVAVAVCLTGNMVISVLGSAVLILLSWIVDLLKGVMMGMFYTTYYESEAMLSIPAFSPGHLIYKMFYTMDRSNAKFLTYSEHMGFYGELILMAAVYTVIALFLYKKRPTEAASRSIAFPVTEPIIKTMVVFPASIFSGYLFPAMFYNGSEGEFGWFLFGCIFGFIIVCPLMEVIFRKDVKAVLSHPWQIVFNGACVAIVVIVLQFDVFGYDSYIPEEEKVESYAISFNSQRMINTNYANGNGYTYRFDHMTITDNESTRKLLEHAAEVTRPIRSGKVTVQEGDDVYYTSFIVKYDLKNGKDVYRSYVVNMEDEQVRQWLADTYNDMQYKLGVYPVLSEMAEREYVGISLNSAYNSERMPLSEEKMQKLVEVYRRELTNLSFEEMTTEYPVADLGLAAMDVTSEQTYPTIAVQEYAGPVMEADGFTYDYREAEYKIYPSFTQTLALLEEYGAKIVNEIPAEDVKNIRITDYTREVYYDDGKYASALEVVYEQANGQSDQIAQILPTLLSTEFDVDFNNGNRTEPNIEVCVTYVYDGVEMYEYFNFAKGRMPEFVVEEMNKAAQ